MASGVARRRGAPRPGCHFPEQVERSCSPPSPNPHGRDGRRPAALPVNRADRLAPLGAPSKLGKHGEHDQLASLTGRGTRRGLRSRRRRARSPRAARAFGPATSFDRPRPAAPAPGAALDRDMVREGARRRATPQEPTGCEARSPLHRRTRSARRMRARRGAPRESDIPLSRERVRDSGPRRFQDFDARRRWASERRRRAHFARRSVDAP